jgi:hypothetical protein
LRRDPIIPLFTPGHLSPENELEDPHRGFDVPPAVKPHGRCQWSKNRQRESGNDERPLLGV